jgi:hypothetical protein
MAPFPRCREERLGADGAILALREERLFAETRMAPRRDYQTLVFAI